jgi:hypothetical protein
MRHIAVLTVAVTVFPGWASAQQGGAQAHTTVQVGPDKVYVLTVDGRLWLLARLERRQVDRDVKAIARAGRAEVYVLGSDGKLWRGTDGEGGRQEVDRGVVAIAPTGIGSVYVLGSDGKLWRGTGAEGRKEVDEQVRAIDPTGAGDV